MVKKADNEPVVQTLDKKADQAFITTGIEAIDGLIGGLARGRILELWGDEKIGKTHLVTDIMSKLPDCKILFVDTEFSLNKARVAELGVDLTKVDYIADSRLERVGELIIASVGKYDLIVLDSIADLTATTVDEAEVGERSIGLTSLLIKHFILKLRPRLHNSKTVFIAINQWRKPIGLYVKPEPFGGKAWHHAVDVRLKMTSNSADKKDGKHILHLTVDKSKVSQPHLTAEYEVRYA